MSENSLLSLTTSLLYSALSFVFSVHSVNRCRTQHHLCLNSLLLCSFTHPLFSTSFLTSVIPVHLSLSLSLCAPYLHYVLLSASHLVQSSRGKKENITTHDHSAAVSAVSAWFSVLFHHKNEISKVSAYH